MLTKRDRANLIEAMELGLALYVIDMKDRRSFADLVAERLQLPFREHFVEACLKDPRKG